MTSLANVSGISNATIERTMNAPLSDSYSQLQLRTIDPDTWAICAYYEPGWFSGASVDQMMKDLKGSNNTIILDRSVAKQLNLKLYDEVGIDFNSCPRKLRIIGFFGPEPSQTARLNLHSSEEEHPIELTSIHYTTRMCQKTSLT